MPTYILTFSCPDTRGVIYASANEHNRRILAAIAERGMVPVVTLQHYTHPAWLGSAPWCDPSSVAPLVGWMRRAVESFGDLCSRWVSINEPIILAINTFFSG
jgi:beta-glucosidase/6-phospho-beta-glucosidase/beta-galactosidase